MNIISLVSYMNDEDKIEVWTTPGVGLMWTGTAAQARANGLLRPIEVVRFYGDNESTICIQVECPF